MLWDVVTAKSYLEGHPSEYWSVRPYGVAEVNVLVRTALGIGTTTVIGIMLIFAAKATATETARQR